MWHGGAEIFKSDIRQIQKFVTGGVVTALYQTGKTWRLANSCKEHFAVASEHGIPVVSTKTRGIVFTQLCGMPSLTTKTGPSFLHRN
jgi:hypothetical protein